MAGQCYARLKVESSSCYRARDQMTDIEAEEMDELEVRWPQANDKAFVEIHPLRGAWAATATNERLYRMIKGFHESGDLLVAETEQVSRKSIDLLYPIIFTYRQSLELRLKYLLMAYAPLVNETPIYRSHDLKKLWSKCKRVILALDDSAESSNKEAFDAVDKLIAEFDAVDSGSDTFRFAHDTKGQPIKLDISAIDLSNLRSVVAGLHNFLECVDLHLHHSRGIPHCEH
jgi:hypothetical protein